MIRVQPSDEPADFGTNVRKKGNAALLELIGSPETPKRPGPKRKKLADRFEDLPADCLPDLDVLDPFEIQDGWFVLDLLTFEVDAAGDLDDATRKAVIATRDRLKLNEPTYCERRKRYHDLYHGLKTEPHDPDEPLPLQWLLHECPFVARELHRQQRLRPGDRITEVPLSQRERGSGAIPRPQDP